MCLRLNQLFIIALILASCSRKDGSQLPLTNGSIDSTGIIQDFKLWDPPSGAVHIDPTNINDAKMDGTIEHPFNSFDQISWHNNTVYALKRGTLLKSGQIRIQGDGITLATYGTGNRPVIRCVEKSTNSENKFAIISDWKGINDVIVRDLEITAPYANSCIRFLSNCQNMKVINCKLHDSEWGLRSISNIGLLVYNTEIYNILDDGMYILDNYTIEIANCYVHNVNKYWKPPSTPETVAGGDGIQFQDCNNWHVHHNIIDRSTTGNKFCFISNNKNQNNGIVEFNIFSGPFTNGASVYFHDGKNIVVRYNYFKEPAESPVFTHSSGIKIYGNIFDHLSQPLIATSGASIYNNVFYKMPICIQGNNIEAVNNVYEITNNGKVYQVNNLISSNNLFVNSTPTEGSFSGEPKFIDPENGDFHLSRGSDCIDQGIGVDIYQDMEGTKIPQGDYPDIGAFEYVEVN
jgi:hypothetical protein